MNFRMSKETLKARSVIKKPCWTAQIEQSVNRNEAPKSGSDSSIVVGLGHGAQD
jgi:hypothetical protein